MIPGIVDILAGLLSGQYTQAQAESWIAQHIELEADKQHLRDHFAGLVIQGLCSNPAYDAPGHERAAREAYAQADAMLKAREE